MLFYFYSLVFIFGCLIGSFLNVIIDRLPKGESIIKGRSHCDRCRHKLLWYDLLPVISFILLGGKCRKCGEKISFYYPAIEILTGFVFAIVTFFIFGQNLFYLTDIRYIITTAYFFYIISSLIVIFFIDLKFGIIPFIVVLYAFISTIFWYLLLPLFQFTSQEIVFFDAQHYFYLNYLLSAICVFLFFLSIFLFTRGKGMGFGDVVYVFLMGFLLGFPKIVLGLYITFLTGALVSLILILARKKKFKGGTVPFGPFLVFGTIISVFWGKFLIDKIMLYFIGS